MDLEVATQAVTARLGRFHLLTCFMLGLVYIYQALYNLSYIFTTMRSEFRCLVPECETDATLADMRPPWLALAVPASQPCRRFVPLPTEGPEGACVPGAFSNMTVPCESWIYPNKDLSIMTEWDMTCSLANDWKLALVGSANNLGRALGLPLFGVVSDALGRRTALLVGLGVSCCLGIGRSLAPNYIAFISLEFLDPVFYDGTGGAAFIMGMELMPDRFRGAWSALGHAIFAFGFSILGLVAWLLPRWRLLLRVVYGSSVMCLTAVWWMPESVRWLTAKGRTEDALRVLKRAAKMNRLPPLTPASKQAAVAAADPAAPAAPADDGPKVAHVASAPAPTLAGDLKEFAHSRVLVLRLIACCLSWIGVLFVYDGLAVYSVSLAGNQYLNFVLVELVEVPAAIITWRMMAAVGRRATLVGSVVPAAACCFAYHFLPMDAFWPRTAAVVLAKLCITVAYTDLYVLSAEMFPTRVRHTMYSLSATFGRFGSVLAPQMPLLAAVMDTLPLIVFGAVSLSCGLLALTFPETAHVALPDSVAEAEAIGRDDKAGEGEAPSAA